MSIDASLGAGLAVSTGDAKLATEELFFLLVYEVAGHWDIAPETISQSGILPPHPEPLLVRTLHV